MELHLEHGHARTREAAPAPVRWVLRLEDSRWPDRLAAAYGPLADVISGSPTRSALLRGRWLGHSAHPMLTMVPLGMWGAASMVDLLGGRPGRRAARRLVATGLLAIVPTVATGLAEWQPTTGPARRVGAVHASVNTAAGTLMACSYLQRRRSRGRLPGVVLALAGNAVASIGGYLGGHLTVVRGVGSRDRAFHSDRES